MSSLIIPTAPISRQPIAPLRAAATRPATAESRAASNACFNRDKPYYRWSSAAVANLSNVRQLIDADEARRVKPALDLSWFKPARQVVPAPTPTPAPVVIAGLLSAGPQPVALLAARSVAYQHRSQALIERALAKRESQAARIEQSPLAPGYWIPVQDGDRRALALYLRHYSARHYRDNRPRSLFVGPGEKMVLLTVNCDALFIWRKFISDDGQIGISCAVFRNESSIRSSDLIKEAVALARKRWPGERCYTYVNPTKIRSVNPGCCFKKAGWKCCGTSKGGLFIFELVRGKAPSPALPPIALYSMTATVPGKVLSEAQKRQAFERAAALSNAGPDTPRSKYESSCAAVLKETLAIQEDKPVVLSHQTAESQPATPTAAMLPPNGRYWAGRSTTPGLSNMVNLEETAATLAAARANKSPWLIDGSRARTVRS